MMVKTGPWAVVLRLVPPEDHGDPRQAPPSDLTPNDSATHPDPTPAFLV